MLIFAWIVLSIAVGIYAKRLHRDPYDWFWASLLISPLLGICLLLALGPKKSGNNQVIEMAHEIDEVFTPQESRTMDLENEEDEYSFSRTTLYKDEKHLEYFSVADGNSYYSLYEYKFEGEKVFIKLTEQFSEDYKGKKEQVKDNVVLLSAIKAVYDSTKIHFRSFEDQITHLKEEIEWHELVAHKTKFSIMIAHKELFPQNELRKIFRKDYERINFGANEVNMKLAELGVVITTTKEANNYSYPEDMEQQKIDEIEEAYSRLPELYNITEYELRSQPEILGAIDNLLNPKNKSSAA